MTCVEVKFGNQIPPLCPFLLMEGTLFFLSLHLSFLPPDTSIDLAADAFSFCLSPRGSSERRGDEQVQKFIKMKNNRHCISCVEEEVLSVRLPLFFCVCVCVWQCDMGSQPVACTFLLSIVHRLGATNKRV